MKVYDFQKAVEYKGKIEEVKNKHSSPEKLNKDYANELLKDSDSLKAVKEISKQFLTEHEQVVNRYRELNDKYIESVEFIDKLAERIEHIASVSDKYSSFSLLAEHFIVKNDLEDKFIEYINEIAENETVKDYRDAAIFKKEDYEIHGFILDEYGFMKEEEELQGEVN